MIDQTNKAEKICLFGIRACKLQEISSVMAINEALASNKSNRELDKMFAKMGLDEQMRKRLLLERINLETALAQGMSIRKRVNADILKIFTRCY